MKNLIKKYYKATLVCFIFGGLLGYFALTVYDKREALIFAYSNPDAVVTAKESYNQEISKAQLNYKANLSRSFIQN